MAREGVYLIGLTGGTACDEFSDKGGHAWPPIILLEQGNGADVSAMGAGEGFVNVFGQGVTGGFGDVEATLVVEGALVKVPVLGGRAG